MAADSTTGTEPQPADPPRTIASGSEEVPFLKLLVEEAPADAFDAPVAAARAAGASREEVDRLNEAAVLALQVRSVLHERRRRENELKALYETAGDLIAIRDVEQVLQAIVRRARRLLGTDTAYLTLIDEQRGDTYMRVTEGTVGEEFRQLRLPLGVGLGGLVAETCRPSFTSDYLDDPRFVHTDRIDGAVASERIQAILGVPLMVGEQVLGVLFASDRNERHFSPDEVNLLSSLGAHAAIAIENARLFQEAQRAVAELNAANEFVQGHSEAVERAAAVHERLTGIVLEGGDLDAVGAALTAVLGASLVVVDESGRVLVRAGDRPPDDVDGLEEALTRARHGGRTVRFEDSGGEDGDGTAGSGEDGAGEDGAGQLSRGCWVTAVVAGSEHLGALVLRSDRELDGADLRTLERAAQVTALLLLNRRSVAEAEHRLRGEFLEDLLGHAHRDPEGLRRRAMLLGLDLDQRHAALVGSGGDRRRMLAAASHLTAARGGFVAERGQAIAVFVAETEPRQAADLLRDELGRADRDISVVGAAGPASGPAALASAYVDADRCRRALLALGRDGETATAAELGVYALLFNESGRTELDAFVERTLGPIEAYDEERGTALAESLQAYFQEGGNVTRAAERLHVHVNTLYQRLDRIDALLGRSCQDPEVGLELHLACRIRRLQARL